MNISIRLKVLSKHVCQITLIFFELLECEQLNLKGKIDTTHSIQFQGINFLMCTFFCLIQGYYGFNKKRMKINNV